MGRRGRRQPFCSVRPFPPHHPALRPSPPFQHAVAKVVLGAAKSMFVAGQMWPRLACCTYTSHTYIYQIFFFNYSLMIKILQYIFGPGSNKFPGAFTVVTSPSSRLPHRRRLHLCKTSLSLSLSPLPSPLFPRFLL